MSGSHPAASVALLGALLLQAAPAHAQLTDDGRARLHFRTGTSYYDQGRYMDAAAQFRESYVLSRRSHILLNVARCFELAGSFSESAATLEEYLQAEPNAPDRRTLEQRIAQLRAHGAADHPGREAGGGSGGGGDLTPSVILLAVGGALALGGVGTGVATLESQSSLESRCSATRVCDPELRSDVGTGEALAITTDVLLLAALASAALGTVLLVLALGESAPEELTPTAACGTSGCVAGVRGGF